MLWISVRPSDSIKAESLGFDGWSHCIFQEWSLSGFIEKKIPFFSLIHFVLWKMVVVMGLAAISMKRVPFGLWKGSNWMKLVIYLKVQTRRRPLFCSVFVQSAKVAGSRAVCRFTVVKIVPQDSTASRVSEDAREWERHRDREREQKYFWISHCFSFCLDSFKWIKRWCHEWWRNGKLTPVWFSTYGLPSKSSAIRSRLQTWDRISKWVFTWHTALHAARSPS